MVSWRELEETEPDFARRVRERFDAGRHKTMATLRADGSPRISGMECEFDGGELTFGSMLGARKLADLRRDARFAFHGPTFHPPEGEEHTWIGEAKISGRAVSTGELLDDDGTVHGEGFRADITEVALTGLNDEATALVVEWWTREQGLRRIERG